MDYRKATRQEKLARLDQLSGQQDILDKLKNAHSFLNLSRCNKCLRVTNSDYCCIHCGYDGGDDDD